MQLVLGYSPLQVGLAFFPGDLIMAIFSLGLSARVVMRFGLRRPALTGLLVAALGLALFSLAPYDGNFPLHILPGMVLLGIGGGLAFNPVLLAAMGDARPEDAGLASGLVNTAFMMGGALGLAVLASVAAARTSALGGAASAIALTSGYHFAFAVGTVFAVIAGLLALLLREGGQAPARDDAVAEPAG
jgi:MFS family permease